MELFLLQEDSVLCSPLADTALYSKRFHSQVPYSRVSQNEIQGRLRDATQNIRLHSCEVKLQQDSYLIKRSQNFHLILAILSDMKEICQNVNNDLFLTAFLSLWKYRVYFHKYIISVTL